MSRVTDIGARRISQNLGELQRVNHFELQFVFGPQSSFASRFAELLGDSRAFSWFVQNVDLPKETSEVNEYVHGNSRVKFAGTTSFDATSLTIVDSCDIDTEKVIASWRKVIYDLKNDVVGKARDYKATLNVYQYSPDGSVERVWVLEGCWPSVVEYGKMNAAETGNKEITMTLTYDHAYRADV